MNYNTAILHRTAHLLIESTAHMLVESNAHKLVPNLHLIAACFSIYEELMQLLIGK